MKHRRYGFLPRCEKSLSADIFAGIVVIAVICTIFSCKGINYQLASKNAGDGKMDTYTVPVQSKPDCQQDDVACLIYKYSKKYGVRHSDAVRIATCESQMGLFDYNMAGSTAKGVYQFIDSTWEYTGGGDVLDAEQNIERFMQYYPNNPHWWECI